MGTSSGAFEYTEHSPYSHQPGLDRDPEKVETAARLARDAGHGEEAAQQSGNSPSVHEES